MVHVNMIKDEEASHTTCNAKKRSLSDYFSKKVETVLYLVSKLRIISFLVLF